MWRTFHTPIGSHLEKIQGIWWKLYYSLIKRREEYRAQ
jgi:hypothetical protein